MSRSSFRYSPFLPADDRGQELKLTPFRQQTDSIDHLLHGLRRDFLAALKAGGASDPGKEETEIVVNFRYGADRGPGIVAGALLLDGNGGREPFDRIDVGLAHLFEELTGIGRERFDVPPLPLGIDRIEGQRRLARPAQPCDHDEPIARDRHIDVLEIVLPRPFDDDRVMHQGRDYRHADRAALTNLEGGCYHAHMVHVDTPPVQKGTDSPAAPLAVSTWSGQAREQAVQRMFTSIARVYDLNNTLLSFGLHYRWKKITASYVPVTTGRPGT